MSNKKKALERQRRRLEERKIRRGELPKKTAPRIAGLSAVDRLGKRSRSIRNPRFARQ